MAEAVVDLFETVDVEYQHGQAVPLVDGLGQLPLEQHPVGQPGDGVVVGQALELRL
ncbi:hypothetical protein D3C81_2137390 [compost metagenome]